MTVQDLELERIAARGWVAEHQRWLGGWLLRANDGFTGRANSVLPLDDPDRPLDDALLEVADWYASFDLAARFTVPSPTRDELRGALLDRGWTPSWGARVMVCPLASLPAVAAAGDVVVRPRITPGWEMHYHYRGHEVPAVGRALLERAEVVGFAEVAVDGEVVAIGRGTVVEGWLGVTAVEVAPGHRRRGLGSAVMLGLADWAGQHDATDAYLQVELGNDPARAMYERLGFVEHHTYRYLDAPRDG